MIDELGLLVRHKLKNQNIELVRKMENGLPPVMGDATQLEQAFLNLILNAAEAMPEGGMLTISSRVRRQTRRQAHSPAAMIEIQDTGKGMPEEQRQRAFKSVLNSTKPKGTGLGLAIVGKIIEAHGGSVNIRSQTGRGTTISVTLPA